MKNSDKGVENKKKISGDKLSNDEHESISSAAVKFNIRQQQPTISTFLCPH